MFPCSRVAHLCPAPLETVALARLPSVWASFGHHLSPSKKITPTVFHGSFLGFPVVVDVKQ